MTDVSRLTPAQILRILNRKPGAVPKGESVRLNVQLTRQEMSLLRTAADLYADGNVSRLVRHLTLSALPGAFAMINRETGSVMLNVSAIPTPGQAPELRAVSQ